MPDVRPEIENRFHEAMLSIYRRAKEECGYNATRFRQIVTGRGGLEAARALLRTTEWPEGFTELFMRGRLDLTMEAMIVETSEWHELFTEEEIQIALSRLADCGYEPRETTHD